MLYMSWTDFLFLGEETAFDFDLTEIEPAIWEQKVRKTERIQKGKVRQI